MLDLCYLDPENERFRSENVLPELPEQNVKDAVDSVCLLEKLTVIPLHERPDLMEECALLINSEWQRSLGARLAQLRSSCDSLPTSLVLLKSDTFIIGHIKLSPIPSDRSSCFIESVVVAKECRGQGFGTLLMRHAELYCQTKLLHLRSIYLSTIDQTKFYKKLGYFECAPITIYGNANFVRPNQPPAGKKVYMKKELP